MSLAVNPWLSHVAVVDEITAETPGVATFHLRLRDPAVASAYRFRPGQFNMLYIPGAGESAISLSANPASTERWAHTIRTAGNVTGLISRLRPGDELGLRGPFGSSWPMDAARDRDVLLIAGGIGLAPLRPAIYELLAHPDASRSVTLLNGVRTPDTLLFPSEYADWSARGMKVLATVDCAGPEWKGHVGVVPLLIERVELPDPSRALVLMCGPEVMMRYSVEAARRRGVPLQNIWLSAERNMQCAVGLCGHCQWGPEFVCKDGPVFRYDRIARYLPFEDL